MVLITLIKASVRDILLFNQENRDRYICQHATISKTCDLTIFIKNNINFGINYTKFLAKKRDI